MEKIKALFAWLQKNERHVSTVFFVGGTTSDILTLTRVSISYAVTLLGIYTAVAIVATIAEHYLFIHEEQEGPFLRGLRLTLAFVAEFMIGCLLSGCLVFYTRSAAITASWPFVLLLIVILFGNEFFRNYRERLAFRMVLLFFTTYAYFIFTVPTVLHKINAETFIESSFVTLAFFLVFLLGLALAEWKRLKQSLVEIVVGSGVVLFVMNTFYFTGIIPPLPLDLRDVGVYHSITYIPGSGSTDGSEYRVLAEASTDPWWDIAHVVPITVHVIPGESLSVFSSVFAPTSFSTGIIHQWDWQNPTTHKWITEAEIAFAISGGRDGGYRGYSTLPDIAPGYYRVSIETASGQVIGRVYFTVQDVSAESILHTEIH